MRVPNDDADLSDDGRIIDLDGCLNFRDIGGYTAQGGRLVRRGAVFRSDALHLISERDVERLRDDLRIGLVIDLRSDNELESEGRGPLGEQVIPFQHVPLIKGDVAAPGYTLAITSLADRYVFLAGFAMAPIAQVLNLLAAATAPTVFHCAAGKDRTGVLSAIILALVGVPDEVIVEDYALTRRRLDSIIRRLEDSPGYRAMLAALPANTLHANPDTMVDFLARMREEYGTFRGYALAAGVSGAAVDQLIDRLLER